MQDFFTEHAGLYYATLVPCVPVSLANGLEMSATFLKGCKGSLTGHFFVSLCPLRQLYLLIVFLLFSLRDANVTGNVTDHIILNNIP